MQTLYGEELLSVTKSLPLTLKAADLIKQLQTAGWYEARQKGSHRIFQHPAKPGNVVVPMHGKKDIPIGTLNQILKIAGLK